MRAKPTRRQTLGGLGALLAFGRPAVGTAAADGRGAAPDDGLAALLPAIEGRLAARLGVVVHDTGTGRRWAHRASERFAMCSTFKLLACGALLARVDAGRDDLDRRVRFERGDLVTYSPVTQARAGGRGMTLGEMCEAALTRSDNTAGNLILAAIGGPAAVTAFARTLGDADTRLDRTETDLNEARPGDPRDTTTPDAMAADLRALVLGDRLAAASRERLTAWLVANRTGDAKLRAGLPKSWRVGDKTGGGDFGTMNDVAVIWPPAREPVVVAVYITQTAASFDARNAAVAEIGGAVAATLAG